MDGKRIWCGKGAGFYQSVLTTAVNVREAVFSFFVDKHNVFTVIGSDEIADLNIGPIGDGDGIGRWGK